MLLNPQSDGVIETETMSKVVQEHQAYWIQQISLFLIVVDSQPVKRLE